MTWPINRNVLKKAKALVICQKPIKELVSDGYTDNQIVFMKAYLLLEAIWFPVMCLIALHVFFIIFNLLF